MLTGQGVSVQHTFPLSSLPQLITLANGYCVATLPFYNPHVSLLSV